MKFIFWLRHAKAGNIILLIAILGCLISGPAEEIYARQLTIDSIIIENKNVFDTRLDSESNLIYRLGNKFHIVTKKRVIKRELLFKEGQLLDTALVSESARNLRKYLTIYDARITVEPITDSTVAVRVTTYDQWSLNLGVHFSREGNIEEYKAGVTEKNFLGTNIYMLFNYAYQSDEGGYIESSYINQRLFKQDLSLRLTYNNNPVTSLTEATLYRSFYSLKQRFGYAARVSSSDLRRDIYRDDIRLAEVSSMADIVDGTVSVRLGPQKRKLLLSGSYRYTFQQTQSIDDFSDNSADSQIVIDNTPLDSLAHTFILGVGYGNYGYDTASNLNGIGYTEDYTIGNRLMVHVGRSWGKNFKNSQFSYLSGSLIFNRHSNQHWIFTTVSSRYHFHKSENLRWLNTIVVHYLWHPRPSLTLLISPRYTAESGSIRQNQLIFGGTTGVRGLDKFFQTGSKRFSLNTEIRLITDWKLLTSRYGIVLFNDLGGIWNTGEKLSLGDLHTAFGLGLRIGFSSSSRKVIRLDWAVTNTGSWEIVVGTNQYLSFPHIF